MHSFMKFPSTPHLATLEGVTVRDDKVLSTHERDRLLARELSIEEKIDGANLGISFDRNGTILTQNRGSFLHSPMRGQWKTLPEWLAIRSDRLFDVLTDRYLLFGEWCYAKHSVFYDRLPDWFVGFDIFDSLEGRFVCRKSRDRFLASLDLHAVPCLASGRFTLTEITKLLGQSCFGETPAEGLYLRYDEREWLRERAKIVRPDFIQTIDKHWSRGPLEVNRLAAQARTTRR